jgi:acid phosphatase
MIRVIVAFMAAVGTIAALVSVHFRSNDTRLTQFPAPLAAVLTGTLPPPPSHVVVVVEENKEYSDIAGNARHAPYLNKLMQHAAVFTHAYGVAHPSQPNYLALFAGVTNQNGDGCPPSGVDTNAPNLATALRSVGKSFAGYSEDLPREGFRGCWSGQYARKHVPWAVFTNVPDSDNVPLSALPAYDRLPTVSFIIPDLQDDMHSASIDRGDAWLQEHLAPIVAWAQTHNALVIVTWDESDDTNDNHIPTLFAGPMVRAGRYDEPITHYRVLRTIEQFYGAPYSGEAADAAPVSNVWQVVNHSH